MGVEAWVLVATVVVLAWLYSRWRHSYWAKRGVPSPPFLPFIGHTHKSLFMSSKQCAYQEELRDKFSGSNMCGLYELLSPALLLWDPELMKCVFIKDFDHFMDRREFDMNSGHERDHTVMEMLSVKNGEGWKALRAIMTPTFTSGKIKNMFPLVCDKADALVKFSMKEAAEKPYVDIKKNFGRYTIDTIASCAFGIECNSLVDEKAEFPRKAEAFFSMSHTRMAKFMLAMFAPKLIKLFRLSINPTETDFFIEVVKQTVAAREAREAGPRRGDFLDLMLEARDNADNRDTKHMLSDRSLVAQSVLFIIAGYETTANLLAFSTYLLAKHKDQQRRLRDEVRKIVAEQGDITYQGIMEAKLLDACLQESLRLYPPALILERACVKKYTFPGTELTLKPGDLVQVPVWSLHHDPRHWPDPEAFIPDRFLPENKGNNEYFAHMPFGMGPRNCIAMRFALLEAKVAMAKLLLKAELELPPGKEELVLDSNGGLLRSQGGMSMLLKPIVEE